MNFYIADTHFGHEKVIEFCRRPFKNIEEMDEVIIKNWNEVVNHEDHVYILGDMIYRNKKEPSYYLKQLKGHKHLILGNHEEYLKKLKEPFKYFDTIDQYLDIVDKGRRCILFHYPIASWNGMNRKVYHIHGHIHNNYHRGEFLTHERALNAGVDINNFKPVKLEELIYNNNKYKLTNL